jgi:plasmid stabilization system protein ParE
MTYRVILQPRAQVEVEEAFRWIAEESPARAEKWFDGLQAAIETLSEFPTRCALAPESDAFSEDLRQLLYGKRSGVYRILFVIRDDTVRVLTVRHGARARLTAQDLQDLGE